MEDEKEMPRLRLSKRAVGKVSAAVAVIVIVVIAAVAGYMLYKPPVTPTETTTSEAPGPTTLVVDKANLLPTGLGQLVRAGGVDLDGQETD